MNENLDLTKILKNCPKGTKFYSSYLGRDVFFIGIHDNYIECDYPSQIDSPFDCMIDFRKNGSLCKEGECMLFPSKDQRDWSKWQRPFKNGDVIVGEDFIGLYDINRKGNIITHCSIDENLNFILGAVYGYVGVERYATEEEKQKLFDTLKAKGYKWNDETKTLEKLIVPKFKVGDTIQSKFDNNDKFTITNIDNNEFYYGCGKNGCGKMCEFMIPVVKQDNWELLPNKFDPKFLKPFDKVLVNSNGEWFCDFFSHYDDSVNQFNCTCTGGWPYDYCIPYNDDTKHLIGKSIEETPEYYRYWED